MPLYTDQLGQPVEITQRPIRIVSLVPSQTELLYDLGLDQEVVGITKFCIHPSSWRKAKEQIGGTKSLRRDKIISLAPDLIIANKEENEKTDIDELRGQFPTWVSDIASLQDALAMVQALGEITGRHEAAHPITTAINNAFESIVRKAPHRVLYLIWKDPWMAAGRGTFIDAMIHSIGWKNCITATRYPQLSLDDIRSLAPAIVLLSSEPFPFRQQHMDLLRVVVPPARIMLVDGEMFSWYGSRLRYSPAYFNSLTEDP